MYSINRNSNKINLKWPDINLEIHFKCDPLKIFLENREKFQKIAH